MRFAVGLHVGEAVVGNLGSASLRCYTAVGDTVNVAKRVQERADGGEILFTEAVYNGIERAIRVEEVGRVAVKGRAAAVTLYRLPDRPARGTKRADPAYAVDITTAQPPSGGGVEG
jgi:class 3 adenylate cyclase